MITHGLWLGTEESFYAYHQIVEQFRGVAPQPVAFDSGEEEDGDLRQLAERYGVSERRIGLSLIENVNGRTVVKVHGSISQNHAWYHELFPGELTSYEAIKDALSIAASSDVEGKIVMDIASPGGVVSGIQSASEYVTAAAKRKGLVAHTDNTAFSAAYWLGASADEFTASKMGQAGSIGTLLVTSEITGMAEKSGVKFHVFRAGQFKAMGLPYETMSEEFQERLQAQVEKTNTFFLSHVMAHRPVKAGDTMAWAEGQTFYADDALKAGLIDGIKSLDEVLGSSTSPQNSPSTRSQFMKISEEKLAQISAGATPEDVLTAEELQHYKQCMKQQPEENAEEETPEETAEESSQEEQEEVAKDDLSMVLNLTKQVGALETKLEASDKKVEELQEQLTAAQSSSDALMEVAQCAINNLCVALGKPKVEPGTAASMASTYTELQGEMASMFKRGQQSADNGDVDPVASSSSNVHSFRNHIKV